MNQHNPAAAMKLAGRESQGLPLFRRRSFSLIEVVGVLAIIAILAALLAPNLIKRVDQAAWNKETADLSALAAALQSAILRYRSIPDQSNWAQVVANELAVPTHQVLTTPNGNARVFLIDPALRLGSSNGTLPYTQGTNGSANPAANARVMILSSRSIPLPLSSGTNSDFGSLWDTVDGTKPSALSGWGGRGEDVRIQRINLGPLFHRLIVNDLDVDRIPVISIDGSLPIQVSTNGFSGYFLDGTVIGFYNDNSNPMVLESRDMLMSDTSYVYERGIWRGQLWEGRMKSATDLAKAVDAFLTSRTNAAKFSATPPAVIDAYYNYVLTYATWSRLGFPDYSGPKQQTPEFQALNNAQNQLDKVSRNLLGKN